MDGYVADAHLAKARCQNVGSALWVFLHFICDAFAGGDIINGDILSRAQNGDLDAFEKIMFSYEKLLYSIAYRYMENLEDAKDITQEAFLKIYNNLSSCQDQNAFKAWAVKITVNTALDELRRRKNKTVVSLDNYTSYISPTSSDPGEVSALRETVRNIMSAIHKLQKDHKTMIILRDLHGISYEEICQITDLPMGTVKSKLSRARTALKKVLENM